NTGISAVVDPVGRVIRELPLGAEGVLDSSLPQPLGPTLYSRMGDLPLALVLAVIGLVAVFRRVKQYTSRLYQYKSAPTQRERGGKVQATIDYRTSPNRPLRQDDCIRIHLDL